MELFIYRSAVGDNIVSVTVTPTGYADAPNGGYFVEPYEKMLKFSDFLDIMENPSSADGVRLL